MSSITHGQKNTKRKRHDPRVPTSTTRIGRWTVNIYDEAAYRANIAQYYQDEDRTPKQHKTLTSLPAKRKSRFRWATPLETARAIQFEELKEGSFLAKTGND